ncbi:conserved hypothetical protein [Gammaproteobacteria bacterium]
MYSKDERKIIFTDICNRVIEDKISFNKAVKDSDISLVSFYNWIFEDDDLKNLYNYAREIRSDVLFEEIIDIADTQEEGITITEKPQGIERKIGDMADHRRLKIDARKWVVSRMNPKKYGDKIQQEISGVDGAPLTIKIGYGSKDTDD